MNTLLFTSFNDPIADLIGEWSINLNIYSIMLRIFLAILFGAIIGYERSSKRHSAGLRTFILVTLMGDLAAILDIALNSNLYLFSVATIIATVLISGNSILFSSKKQIKGLTTSVGLILCEILGLFIGLGYYLVSIILCGLLVLILALFPRIEMFLKDKSNHFEIHLELKEKNKLQDFIFTLRKLQIRIDDIELNSAYIGSCLSVYSISVTDEKKKNRKHKDIIDALSTIEYVYYIDEIK